MTAHVISVQGLCHEYGQITAVDNIYFNVKEGQIFSFLGPNGAGKTTTISILITLLPLQKGKVTISGFDVATEQESVRRSIGVVFQDNRLDRDLTIWETLDFHGKIYAIPKEIRRSRIDELLSLVELTDKRNEFIKNLSGGMKRRIEIARGLLIRPKVLFLDEPTSGLDTQARRRIWSYIKRINKEENVTVFLTTHYLDEADQYSDEVCIIDKGKIMANGRPTSLKNSIGEDRFLIHTDYDEKALELLSSFPEITRMESSAEGLIIHLKNYDLFVSKLVKTLVNAGLHITVLNEIKPTLDDVFFYFTGRGLNDGMHEANGPNDEGDA
jgi:ABC-2 type transport system ATP-binding protein